MRTHRYSGIPYIINNPKFVAQNINYRRKRRIFARLLNLLRRHPINLTHKNNCFYEP